MTLSPRFAIIVIGFVLLAAPVCRAASKITSWETGKLLDAERKQELLSVAASGSTVGGVLGNHSHSAVTPVYGVYEEYSIESNRYIYLTREHLRSSRSKSALLAINGPVKFHVDGRKLVILGNEGKEHETTIVKQVSRSQDTGLPQATGAAANQSELPVAKPMTNNDVITLKKAGIGDELIIVKVKSSQGTYGLDPADIIALHEEGISDAVIAAMLQSAAH
jgi:hypothetical protein